VLGYVENRSLWTHRSNSTRSGRTVVLRDDRKRRSLVCSRALRAVGLSQVERRAISERTRAALALARVQGVRLGRPPQMSPYAIERIRRRAGSRPQPGRDRGRTQRRSHPHRPGRSLLASSHRPLHAQANRLSQAPSRFAGTATRRGRRARTTPAPARPRSDGARLTTNGSGADQEQHSPGPDYCDQVPRHGPRTITRGRPPATGIASSTPKGERVATSQPIPA
jgi:hypothetical protein